MSSYLRDTTLVNESFSTCALTETMPCRYFGHWPALFFFPDLELSTLRAIQHFQLRDGEPPFCLGVGFAIREPRYHCQHPAGAGEFAQMIRCCEYSIYHLDGPDAVRHLPAIARMPGLHGIQYTRGPREGIAEVVQMAPTWAFVRTTSAGKTLHHSTGKTTAEALQSGLVYGFAGQVDGMVRRIAGSRAASATI